MSSQPVTTINRRVTPGVRWIIAAAAIIILLGAMALDTKVVVIGSAEDARKVAFSPEAFGKSEFPNVQSAVDQRAVAAGVLASAIAKDKAAAEKQYGVPANVGTEFSVKFTGVVGEGKSGIYNVKVDDVPSTLVIRVQTGPAINGTDLRDATGTITFGQFTNQIEYQNAGSALNNEMKKQVLSTIDNTKLIGKTISVVGVFKLINPKGWLVTPVKLSVQ
ncbi:lipoprotein [Mesorhizobium tianshanense]|uniref:Putative lipoprotein n=1 Tax=Mesorhizobium tianshanense TaxID=39844 RepID=A0A562P2W8_9HYPH|nr:DUF2291 domain-containing protein [Mesorhizobium tianshanense]TWI38785.1 putative lipoprotein [Mesorhizobium tianshanense]GLS38183.1 lipoprotein [Mesorhizobium tianshanense]